jgi:very-short-patch-repair endonuclease
VTRYLRRDYIRYRKDLKSRGRRLRRDQTPAERKLWYVYLCDHPFKFTRQKPLGQYIADFYCARSLLAVELDGDSHFSVEAEKRDAMRTQQLARLGIRIVRFKNSEVMEQFEGVCMRIEDALRANEPEDLSQLKTNPPLA